MRCPAIGHRILYASFPALSCLDAGGDRHRRCEPASKDACSATRIASPSPDASAPQLRRGDSRCAPQSLLAESGDCGSSCHRLSSGAGGLAAEGENDKAGRVVRTLRRSRPVDPAAPSLPGSGRTRVGAALVRDFLVAAATIPVLAKPVAERRLNNILSRRRSFLLQPLS